MERRVRLMQIVILSLAFLKVSVKPFFIKLINNGMCNVAFRLVYVYRT